MHYQKHWDVAFKHTGSIDMTKPHFLPGFSELAGSETQPSDYPVLWKLSIMFVHQIP